MAEKCININDESVIKIQEKTGENLTIVAAKLSILNSKEKNIDNLLEEYNKRFPQQSITTINTNITQNSEENYYGSSENLNYLLIELEDLERKENRSDLENKRILEINNELVSVHGMDVSNDTTLQSSEKNEEKRKKISDIQVIKYLENNSSIENDVVLYFLQGGRVKEGKHLEGKDFKSVGKVFKNSKSGLSVEQISEKLKDRTGIDDTIYRDAIVEFLNSYSSITNVKDSIKDNIPYEDFPITNKTGKNKFPSVDYDPSVDPFNIETKVEFSDSNYESRAVLNELFEGKKESTSTEILEKISKSDSNLSALAKTLLKYVEKLNIKIQIVEDSYLTDGIFEGTKANAVYDSKTNTILIAGYSSNPNNIEKILVHEILHSLTVNQLGVDSQLTQDFQAIFEYAKSKLGEYNGRYDTYPLHSIEEFIVGLFENKEFIEKLQELSPVSGIRQYRNLFEEIIDKILNFFGINKKENPNLYTQAFAVATHIINEEVQNTSSEGSFFNIDFDEEFDFSTIEEEVVPTRGFADFTLIINNLQNRLVKLTDALKRLDVQINNSSDKDREVLVKRRTYLAKVKSQTSTKLKDFTDLKKPNRKLYLSKTHLKKFIGHNKQIIDTLLSQDNITATELNILDEILNFMTYKNLKDVLDLQDVSEDDKNELVHLLAGLSSREDDIRSLRERYVVKDAKKEGFSDFVLKDVTHLEDDTFFGSYTQSLAASVNKLVQYINVILEKAKARIRQERVDVHDEISTMFEEFKKTDEYKRNGFKMFWNETKGQVSKFNSEYNEKISEIFKALKEDETTKAKLLSGEDFYNFIFDNHNFVFSHNFIKPGTAENKDDFTLDYSIDPKGLEDEKKRLSSLGLDEDHIEELIDSAIKNYEDYLNNVNDKIITEIENTKAKDKDKKPLTKTQITNITKQASKNQSENPVKTSQVLSKALESNNKTALKNIQANIAKQFISKNKTYVLIPKSNFYSSEYKNIMSNEVYKKVYKYTNNVLNKYKTFVPPNLRKNMGSNWLPYVKASSDFKILQNNTVGSLLNKVGTLASDGFKNSFTVSNITDTSKVIPIRYLFEYELQGEQRETDLEKILKHFTETAINYKHMSSVESSLNTAATLVRDAKNIRDESKEAREKAISYKSKLQSIVNQVEYVIDSDVYGRTKEYEHIDEAKKNRIYSAKDMLPGQESSETKKDKALVDEIELLKTEISDFIGPIAQKTELIKKKEEKEKALKDLRKKAKYFSLNRLGDFLNSAVRLSGIGFSPVSALANTVQALSANMIEASAGQDFTTKELFKAIPTVLNMMKNKSKISDNPKAKGLVKFLDKSGIIENKEYKEGNNKFEDWAYFMMQQGDNLAKAQMVVSSMLHEKINNVPLYEYLNEKGEFALPEGVTFDYEKYQIKLRRLSDRMYGDYLNTTLLNKTVWGRMIGVFRRWIFEGVDTRFGKEFYDSALERKVKGRYRSFTDLGLEKATSLLLDIAKNKSIDELRGIYKDLDDVDIYNMKKNFRELQYMLTLTASLALMSAAAGDDDEEESFVYNFTYNVFGKLNNDATFFINPYSFEEIIKSPIPAIGFMTKTWDSIIHLGEFVGSGESENLLRGIKPIPFVNTVPKIYFAGKEIYKN